MVDQGLDLRIAELVDSHREADIVVADNFVGQVVNSYPVPVVDLETDHSYSVQD